MCHKFGQDILVWSLWCPQGYFYICRLWAWLLTSDLGHAWPCQWSRSQSTNIKSIGNILSWTICEPIWSVLFLLCSHAYFHIYSLWSVNWPRKSLGYKVMMCRTDKLIHGTNTTYPLCNLLQAMLYSTLLCTSQISWFVFRLPVSNKHYSKAIHSTYWRVPTVDYGQYGKNADAKAL